MQKLFKKSGIELEFIEWYGFKNINSCFFSFWLLGIGKILGNCGLTIIPIRFWEHIYINWDRDSHRFSFGAGLFSFFISFGVNTK